MALRELLATFGFAVDTSALSGADSALGNVTESLASMGKGVLAAFAVDAVFSFGRETLQIADALAKQAGALGVSTQQLQGWQHAASLSGSSAEEFTAALTKFTRNVNESGEAAAGPAAKAFKELGVTIKDELTGKLGQPIDLLDGVVAGLENIQDPAKRTALVMDLFGKSGARLLPLFSEGTEGIKALRAEVEELGFGFDEAFLENAQEVNDNVDRVKMGLRGLAIQVIGPMLPDIVELSKGAISVAKSFIGWIKQTNVTRAVVTGLGMKALPVLIAGMKTLGSIALRTVAPFLLLEDTVGWLAGDDSAIGEALDKIFGAGTGEAARKELLQWFTSFRDLLSNDVVPALKSVAESPLFTGAVKTALDAVLSVLKLIGLALTDNEERAGKLVDSLGAGLERLGVVTPRKELESRREAQFEAYEKGAADPTPLSPFWSTVQKGMFSVFGNPYDDPNSVQSKTLAANNARADAAIAANRSASEPAPPVGPPVPVDYTAAFRAPAAATAPAPVASYDYSQTTIAPVTTVEVKVEGGGGDEAVGTRIGKAAGKKITEINTRAVQAALVPTPGG
jgi:hypothetical protein